MTGTRAARGTGAAGGTGGTRGAGGTFKPTAVSLEVVVGAGDAQPVSADALVAWCHWLVQCTLPADGLGTFPDQIVLSIGDWWKRKGYIEDLDIEFTEPWCCGGKCHY